MSHFGGFRAWIPERSDFFKGPKGPKGPLGPERSDFFKVPKGLKGPLGPERSDFFKGPKGPLGPERSDFFLVRSKNILFFAFPPSLVLPQATTAAHGLPQEAEGVGFDQKQFEIQIMCLVMEGYFRLARRH